MYSVHNCRNKLLLAWFLPNFKVKFLRPSWICQIPVQSPSFSLRLGVDFISPLSQQEQQQQEEPHQNIPEENILEVLNLTQRLIHSSPPTDNNPTPIVNVKPLGPDIFWLNIFDTQFCVDPKMFLVTKIYLDLKNFLDQQSENFFGPEIFLE